MRRTPWGFFIIVAIIDTGIDIHNPKFIERLAVNRAEKLGNLVDDDRNGYIDDTLGWNFSSENPDVSDLSNHGTPLAEVVLESCSSCSILPIKVTDRGGLTNPDILARSMTYASSRGAKILLIAAGAHPGSDKLRSTFENLARGGIVTVVPAGAGALPPYRPRGLSALYPQSYPEVTLVGVTQEGGVPDPQTNTGDELDFAVPPGPGRAYGSSYAAAWISAIVASKISHNSEWQNLHAPEIRARLRAATRPPNPIGGSLRESLQRVGYGIFDASLLENAFSGANYWGFRNKNDGSIRLEINSSEDIQNLTLEWSCRPGTYVLGKYVTSTKKGRARVLLPKAAIPDSPQCPLVMSSSSNSKQARLKMEMPR